MGEGCHLPRLRGEIEGIAEGLGSIPLDGELLDMGLDELGGEFKRLLGDVLFFPYYCLMIGIALVLYFLFDYLHNEFFKFLEASPISP